MFPTSGDEVALRPCSVRWGALPRRGSMAAAIATCLGCIGLGVDVCLGGHPPTTKAASGHLRTIFRALQEPGVSMPEVQAQVPKEQAAEPLRWSSPGVWPVGTPAAPVIIGVALAARSASPLGSRTGAPGGKALSTPGSPPERPDGPHSNTRPSWLLPDTAARGVAQAPVVIGVAMPSRESPALAESAWVRSRRGQRRELLAARASFSEPMASAFAALSRLSACGCEPGVVNAVAATCPSPGTLTASTCRAALRVQPGRVFLGEAGRGAFYVAEARVGESGETRALLALHAERPRLARLAEGLANCAGCSVHVQHLETAIGLMPRVRAALELVCRSSCLVHITGHGPGAALAQLVAWQLAQEGQVIGASYLFNAPMVGDGTFAERMLAAFRHDRLGPVFNVVTGRGSTWPEGAQFKAWAYEAYFESTASTVLTAMCLGAEPLCLMAQGSLARKEPNDTSRQGDCASALAPDRNLCLAKDSQCLLGMPL